MSDWFREMTRGSRLPPEAAIRLRDVGFCVVPGPVPTGGLDAIAAAYDQAMTDADPADTGVGRTTIRVSDFVNRGADFDPLYIHGPLLDACYQTVGQPFKLSSMAGRTLLPGKPAQELHVDYPRDAQGRTMVGFIFMIDEFRMDNGATCFVPGSHQQTSIGETSVELVPASGQAGFMIIYNGSVWHGHGANATGKPRRSVQGALIQRDATPALNFASRMKPETLRRIGSLAKYLLAL